MSKRPNPICRDANGVAMTNRVATADPVQMNFAESVVLKAREHHLQTTGNKHAQMHAELKHALKAPMLAGRLDTDLLGKLWKIAAAALERSGSHRSLKAARVLVHELVAVLVTVSVPLVLVATTRVMVNDPSRVGVVDAMVLAKHLLALVCVFCVNRFFQNKLATDSGNVFKHAVLATTLKDRGLDADDLDMIRSDAEMAGQLFFVDVPTAARAGLSTLVCLAALFHFDARYGALGLGAVAVVVLLLVLYQRFAASHHEALVGHGRESESAVTSSLASPSASHEIAAKNYAIKAHTGPWHCVFGAVTEFFIGAAVVGVVAIGVGMEMSGDGGSCALP